MDSKKGVFIAFEGIDGCGKSTQIMKFVEYLFKLNKYNHVVLTRNPYKSREIREILKLDEPPESKSEKLAELFVNDRKEHAKEVVIPNLEKGNYVISDRHKLSTIAYQSSQGMAVEKLIEMHKDVPIPDVIFIVDTPAEIAAERMKKDTRDKEHKFEASLDFQKKVRQQYLDMQKYLPNEKIVIIDGTKSIDQIQVQIQEEFAKLKL